MIRPTFLGRIATLGIAALAVLLLWRHRFGNRFAVTQRQV